MACSKSNRNAKKVPVPKIRNGEVPVPEAVAHTRSRFGMEFARYDWIVNVQYQRAHMHAREMKEAGGRSDGIEGA
ncbi:hypothetical protein COLO4_32869 [Corchorus olitorius]|uniref:Uncharacterized protein n=1 Tax=Corchorus olitorius TaxID=93759 RepID=A0A1R3GXH8_9ROSI|nr:hypothetical protein COLO4_32869 [Corchorus olitorius]